MGYRNVNGFVLGKRFVTVWEMKPTPTSRPARSAKRPPNEHVRTRKDHATELAEDYVEAIDDLISSAGECRITDLARQFGVSHVTAHRTVKRLVRDELAETERYGPVKLTRKGRRLARECRRRHEIVYRFLRAHGISEDTARLDAEGLEHHVSPETLQVMQDYAESAGTGTDESEADATTQEAG